MWGSLEVIAGLCKGLLFAVVKRETRVNCRVAVKSAQPARNCTSNTCRGQLTKVGQQVAPVFVKLAHHLRPSRHGPVV